MPITDTDYGTDLWFDDDLDPTGRMVSGTLLVGQAIYRRLITPRGGLIDDPDYGLDVKAFLSRAQTPAQIASIPSQIEQEVLKDERVDSCKATVTDKKVGAFTLTLQVQTGLGPFRLTVGVNDAATILLGVESEGS